MVSFKYCPNCSEKYTETPSLDNSYQYCDKCQQKIYHHTPQTAASIVLNQKGEILLVKRKNEPFKGMWSLPAGFVNYGENPPDAAIRELKEETNLTAEVEKVVGVYLADDHPKTFSILTVVKLKNVKGNISAKDDASDINYYKIDHLPPMAFKAQVEAIECVK